MKSYAKLFDESREALLELVASGVEAYYRQRTALEKTLPEVPEEDEPGEGDFLHDFINLNVQYLNQLARLGSSYSIVGARALERLYEWAQPPERDNRLQGKAGEHVRYPFTVENPTRYDVNVSCRLGAFSDGIASIRVEHALHALDGGTSAKALTIPPGEARDFELVLTVSPRLRPGVDYRASFVPFTERAERKRRRGGSDRTDLGGDEAEHLIVLRRALR